MYNLIKCVFLTYRCILYTIFIHLKGQGNNIMKNYISCCVVIFKFNNVKNYLK